MEQPSINGFEGSEVGAWLCGDWSLVLPPLVLPSPAHRVPQASSLLLAWTWQAHPSPMLGTAAGAHSQTLKPHEWWEGKHLCEG